MAQRCACILLVEQVAQVSATDIAIALTGQTHGELFDDRCKTVKKMIDSGSYYRSLEQALGKGVTLALGISLAEDT